MKWYWLKAYSRWLIMIFAATLAGCQPASSLLSGLISESDPKLASQAIPMQIHYQGQALTCASQMGIEIDKAKWFVSDLRLTFADMSEGESQAPKLLPSNSQQQGSALVTVLDCVQGEEQGSSAHIRFAADQPWQQAQTLQFTLGLPHELNHGNPLTLPPPLDQGDMYWVWQSGHKFMRVDLRYQEQPWAFHLGSLGCQSASAVRPPKEPCVQPNRFSMTLTAPPKKVQGIALHLDRLLTNLSMDPSNQCVLHNAAQPACDVIMKNVKNLPIFDWY